MTETNSPDATPRAEGSSPLVLRQLSFADPLRWLALGWNDFRRAPALGLFYGLCFVIMGWSLLKA